ncbi:hypothetical protein FB451DRAFT_1364408 [Mycena latifolia]|nr:hypothetical protein FB451DRAFT_1364408 [Mycena latifolia]
MLWSSSHLWLITKGLENRLLLLAAWRNGIASDYDEVLLDVIGNQEIADSELAVAKCNTYKDGIGGSAPSCAPVTVTRFGNLSPNPTIQMNARCSECASLQTPSVPFDLHITPGTPHHRFFNSNEAPLEPDDVDLVKSAVSNNEDCLARIDREISRVRDRLKDLEITRGLVATHLARNRSILSPLRRMPPEILLDIFSLTLPSILTARRRDRFNVNDVPWTLSHISSYWRSVALASPSLWSLVAVNYTAFVEDPAHSYPFPMLETQLARAQSLKIHFYASTNSETRPQTEMFQFLAAHSSRWEELSISLTSDLVPLLSALRNRMPSLRRLWLQWDSPASQEAVNSIDCFQTAPSLIDVGVYNEYRSIPILLPAHQLTRYHLDGPWTVQEEILKLGQNLVEARIDVRFDQTPWLETTDIIDLPSLRRLYVSEPNILDYIQVPHLQEIALWIGKDDDADILKSLEPLVARSSCPLRRLCLKGVPTAHSAVEILNKFPSIVELGIIIADPAFSAEVNTLLSTFTVPDVGDSTPVAPHLSCMFFGCDNESYIDYTMYLEMVQSRWKSADCNLEGAALLTDAAPGPDAVTLRGLDALRQEGLDVFLLEGPEASEIMGGWIYTSLWN